MKGSVDLIVGLGNPGPEYQFTRHNMGFMVVEALREKYRGRWVVMPSHSMHAKVSVAKNELTLLCPLTYMNNSGKAVKDVVGWLELEPSQILVIHDDLDLAMGRLKLVSGGGSGGHRGVSSVLDALGTNQVPRLKVGIGRPRFSEDVVDYVLSPFGEDELPLLEQVIQKATYSCELLVLEGLPKAMSIINSLKSMSKGGTS